MEEERGLLLNNIFRSYINMYIYVNVCLFLLYFTFSSVFILLPCIFLNWNDFVRSLSLFIGVVICINNILPTVYNIWYLIMYKINKLKNNMLTDEEFVDMLNYVLLRGYEVEHKYDSFNLCVLPSSYFNNAPKLNGYSIIKEYTLSDVDTIIMEYMYNNYYMAEYREAILDYATYLDLKAVINSDDFSDTMLIRRLEVEFELNVNE